MYICIRKLLTLPDSLVHEKLSKRGLCRMPDDLIPPIYIYALQNAYVKVLEDYGGTLLIMLSLMILILT